MGAGAGVGLVRRALSARQCGRGCVTALENTLIAPRRPVCMLGWLPQWAPNAMRFQMSLTTFQGRRPFRQAAMFDRSQGPETSAAYASLARTVAALGASRHDQAHRARRSFALCAVACRQPAESAGTSVQRVAAPRHYRCRILSVECKCNSKTYLLETSTSSRRSSRGPAREGAGSTPRSPAASPPFRERVKMGKQAKQPPRKKLKNSQGASAAGHGVGGAMAAAAGCGTPARRAALTAARAAAGIECGRCMRSPIPPRPKVPCMRRSNGCRLVCPARPPPTHTPPLLLLVPPHRRAAGRVGLAAGQRRQHT